MFQIVKTYPYGCACTLIIFFALVVGVSLFAFSSVTWVSKVGLGHAFGEFLKLVGGIALVPYLLRGIVVLVAWLDGAVK